MARNRLVLKTKVLRELRNRPAMKADLKERAEKIAESAGPDSAVLVNELRRNRAGVTVVQRSRKPGSHRALFSALSAGKG